jgi:hypothetical protein
MHRCVSPALSGAGILQLYGSHGYSNSAVVVKAGQGRVRDNTPSTEAPSKEERLTGSQATWVAIFLILFGIVLASIPARKTIKADEKALPKTLTERWIRAMFGSALVVVGIALLIRLSRIPPFDVAM